MNIHDIQHLLTAAGYYKGDIDGDAGPQTMRAVDIIRANGLRHDWEKWTKHRQLVGAAQVILAAQGYEPGPIDGYAGHNTREAFTAWLTEKARGTPVLIDRVPGPDFNPAPPAHDYPRDREADMRAFYGPPGSPDATAGVVQLPIPFVLGWAPDQHITSFRCHRRLATVIQRIFSETARHYGEAQMEALRLNRFDGCFNPRKKRGGSSWSVHAYGAAWDLDASNNQLRWGSDRATFAADIYDPYFTICEAHGAISLGRAINRDWMHVQFARP